VQPARVPRPEFMLKDSQHGSLPNSHSPPHTHTHNTQYTHTLARAHTQAPEDSFQGRLWRRSLGPPRLALAFPLCLRAGASGPVVGLRGWQGVEQQRMCYGHKERRRAWARRSAGSNASLALSPPIRQSTGRNA